MSDYEFDEAPQPEYGVPNSNMALISLIAGVLGWTILPGIASIVAIVTGHMAKREIRESGGALGGEGLATIGLVLGYSSVAIALLAICGFVAFFLFFAVFGITSSEFSTIPLILSALPL